MPGSWFSADQQPAVDDDYVGKEVQEGCIAEVTDPELFLRRNQVNGADHRFSYPEGASVNDGIKIKLCSLEYVTVDHMLPECTSWEKVQHRQN